MDNMPDGQNNYQAPNAVDYPQIPQYQQQPYPNQQYQQQGYLQQPQPKKKKRWPWVVGIIVLALVLCGVISVASNAGSSTNQSSPTAGTTNSTTTTSAPAKAPTSKPLTWKTVKTFSGTGSEKTDTFTVGSTWKLNWTCNPASFQNIQYNIIATVEDSSGALVDTGVNALCKPGSTSGSTDVTSGGTVRLDIISEGDWTFTIQEQQ